MNARILWASYRLESSLTLHTMKYRFCQEEQVSRTSSPYRLLSVWWYVAPALKWESRSRCLDLMVKARINLRLFFSNCNWCFLGWEMLTLPMSESSLNPCWSRHAKEWSFTWANERHVYTILNTLDWILHGSEVSPGISYLPKRISHTSSHIKLGNLRVSYIYQALHVHILYPLPLYDCNDLLFLQLHRPS